MLQTICYCIWMLVTWNVQAQEMIFSTRPAARKVGLKDPFEVRYSIQNGGRIQRFSLPPMQDFEIVGGPMQSQSTTITNGEVSSSLDITYVFRAKRTGQLIIPGGIAQAEGKTYRSNEVDIEVIEGSVVPQQAQRRSRGNSLFDDPFFDEDPFGADPFAAMRQQQQRMMQQMQKAFGAPPPTRSHPNAPQSINPEIVSKDKVAENIFIRVEVDKRQVKLGEQITATYKLYARLPMQVNLTRLPSLIGFWSQDFAIPNPPRPTREFYNGKEYQVFVLKKSALFPTQSGDLTLDPAEAKGKVTVASGKKKARGDDPFGGLFDHFFSDPSMSSYEMEEVPVALESDPVNIKVNPLPVSNKPENFKGAVGNYTLESDIDKTELSTDDVATLTIRISGSGNLKLIEAPVLKFPEELDVFDPEILDTITNNNNTIAGYKTFSFSISPKYPGTFIIPASSFSYFDPSKGEYQTLQIPSYTLNVSPGKQNASGEHAVALKDIHDIHTNATQLKQTKHSQAPKSPFYWGGFVLPILAYGFLAIVKRREEKLQSNAVLFRNKRANKVALKRLAMAEQYLKQSAQSSFYDETAKAVWLYLSDKLNIPLSGLSREMAEAKLQERQIAKSTRDEFFRVATECERALYSPDSGILKMHQTYGDALRLIGQLEESLT